MKKFFWRYCSHELRTPITTIGVGLDYLQKLILAGSINYEKEIYTISKLKKSIYSMSQIIKNLLWLGRNQNDILPTQCIELSTMVNEVISDISKIYVNNYGKINIKTSSFTVYLPKQILRIVLENIIRNAFQHSFGDDIFIIQNKNKITVINSIICNNKLKENIGFGLGIEIIKRITKKLKWIFNIYKNSKVNIVTIVLPKH